MAITSIRNETPSKLTLVSIEDEEMVLAPLQEKEISKDLAFDFDDLAREGIVSTREIAPGDVGTHISTVAIGGGFWLVIICSILANIDKPFFSIEKTSWPWAVWGSGALLLVAGLGIVIVRGTNSFSLVVRWTMQTVSLTVILAIGVGLPAASIFYFGDGQTLLSNLLSPTQSVNNVGSNMSLALFGRALQLAFIAIASLLPILLFFLFDRFQLGTLRKRLYANLFRLDPSLNTTAEINAKYGSQIDEAFGSEDQGRGRLSPGSRWPVLVCALVITLGWIVTLAPVGSDFKPNNPMDVLNSLQPQASALVFGFLGVYFYSLRLIALRYARGDLKPKAYTHIMVRVFIVAVLSWVLDAISAEAENTQSLTLVMAFLFGITPDEFFVWLKERFRGKITLNAIPVQSLPLDELEGIDLYDMGRLESEGIVNIEGLAHHELIDLIIETRIPVPRLVDWIDQAILYLHLIGGSDNEARSTLRNYGIRTATDLQIAWKKAADRKDDSLLALKQLLGGEKPLYRLEVIRDALSDDEWMNVISYWRDQHAHPEIHRKAIPSSPEALQKRGEKELQAERYARALSFFLQSIKERDTATVRRKIALILSQSPVTELLDADQARQHAARAFELAQSDYQGFIELFEIYMALDDIDNAQRMIEIAQRTVNNWPSSKQRQEKEESKRLAEFQSRLEMAKKVGDKTVLT